MIVLLFVMPPQLLGPEEDPQRPEKVFDDGGRKSVIQLLLVAIAVLAVFAAAIYGFYKSPQIALAVAVVAGVFVFALWPEIKGGISDKLLNGARESR